MEEQRDQKLWRIARKRAEFRKSVFTYVIVNAFLWFVWWFSGGIERMSNNSWGMPWPAWVSLGWGFGLALSYYNAYHSDKSDMAEREYEK